MLKKISISLAALLLGFGLTFGAIFFWRNNTPRKPEANLIGGNLPAANLSTANGEIFDNKELSKGKVLIMFLSADCTACKAEIQQIAEMYPTISSQIQIYGINVDPKEKQNALAENKDINFPVLIDDKREFANSLLVKGVPTKFLIQDGIVKKVFVGRFIDRNDARQKMELP
ncbi:MAG TPA: TlpA disulfide reductase family protein [Pyrinomonadaceae bacterium]|jgi:peroxiredoxin